MSHTWPDTTRSVISRKQYPERFNSKVLPLKIGKVPKRHFHLPTVGFQGQCMVRPSQSTLSKLIPWWKTPRWNVVRFAVFHPNVGVFNWVSDLLAMRCAASKWQFPTVDGSEIPRPTTWNGAKTLWNKWDNTTFPSTGYRVLDIPGGCLGFLNHQQDIILPQCFFGPHLSALDGGSSLSKRIGPTSPTTLWYFLVGS